MLPKKKKSLGELVPVGGYRVCEGRATEPMRRPHDDDNICTPLVRCTGAVFNSRAIYRSDVQFVYYDNNNNNNNIHVSPLIILLSCNTRSLLLLTRNNIITQSSGGRDGCHFPTGPSLDHRYIPRRPGDVYPASSPRYIGSTYLL